jgi:DNA-binding CsgD family transcriptional regulator
MQIAVSDIGFHQQLARLLRVPPADPGFWLALSAFLHQVAPFDTWVAMLFRTNSEPLVLDDQAVNRGDSGLFAAYREGLYVLDPFYQFCLQPLEPGIYRLDEVAPSCFRETEYFKRYFSLNVVADEVQYLVPAGEGRVVSLSLGASQTYDGTAVGALHLFAPWVLELMRQATRGLAQAVQSPSGRQAGLATRLRGRAAKLTERELEVATLILAGHSTKGLARALEISPDTAKAHRRNLYAKLGIGSQAELFLLLYGEDAA